MTRILAVDYGRARIGLALSDPSRTIASPAGIIKNRGRRLTLNDFEAFAKQHPDIGIIVVGLPLYPDGNESPMSAETRAFGGFLRERLNIEVDFFDERCTSAEAESIMKAVGSKNSIDAVAAAVILQSYISLGKH